MSFNTESLTPNRMLTGFNNKLKHYNPLIIIHPLEVLHCRFNGKDPVKVWEARSLDDKGLFPWCLGI